MTYSLSFIKATAVSGKEPKPIMINPLQIVSVMPGLKGGSVIFCERGCIDVKEPPDMIEECFNNAIVKVDDLD